MSISIRKNKTGFTPVKSGSNRYLTGFTLIELLVVVAIIGVLAAIVIINLTGAKASSRYAKTVAEMTDMAKSVNVYKETHNDTWPEGWSGYGPGADGDYHFNNIGSGAGANDFLVDMYNGQIPEPPCLGAHYAYYIHVKSLHPDQTDGVISIVYFPVSSAWSAAYVDVGGGVSSVGGSDIDIRDKPTKRITCNERSYAAGGGAWTFNQ